MLLRGFYWEASLKVCTISLSSMERNARMRGGKFGDSSLMPMYAAPQSAMSYRPESFLHFCLVDAGIECDEAIPWLWGE